MDRILVIGDTHCHFDRIDEIIAALAHNGIAVTAVLHTGDLGLYDRDSQGRVPARDFNQVLRFQSPWRQFQAYLDGEKKFAVPIYAVPGNHEDFTLVQQLYEGTVKVPDFHLLRPGTYAELSLNGKKIRVAGMGRIIHSIATIESGKPAALSADDLERMKRLGKKFSPEILLLHEAPFLGKGGLSMFFGKFPVSETIMEVKPKVAFSGHQHFEYSAKLGPTRLYGLGYGADGSFGLLDEKLRFSFHALRDGVILAGITEIKAVPGTQLIYDNYREAHLARQHKTVPRAGEIIEHFKISAPEGAPVYGYMGKLIHTLRMMERNSRIESREDAFFYAEMYLKENGFLE